METLRTPSFKHVLCDCGGNMRLTYKNDNYCECDMCGRKQSRRLFDKYIFLHNSKTGWNFPVIIN